MMVSMAALQVFVVRFFFQGARKGTFLSAYLVELDLGPRLLEDLDWNTIPITLVLDWV
jgi:hypothetical protein